MATHNIFFSGPRIDNGFGLAMLPSRRSAANAHLALTDRHITSEISLGRQLVWKHQPDTYAMPLGTLRSESLALETFLDNNTLADGDVLVIQELPKYTKLIELFVNVIVPAVGLKVDIEVEGTGTEAGTLKTLASAVDLGTAGTKVIPIAEADRPYFKLNDALQLRLSGYDREQLRCSDVYISAVMRRYMSGHN